MSPPRRTSRLAGRTRSRAPSGKRRKDVSAALADLHAVLDRFHSALAIVSVARVAIEASDQLASEEYVLRQGITSLDDVYNELDKAIIGVSALLPHR